MKRFLPWIALLALALVPMWLKDPYLLNAFITTGIFIVAAMSLNLLLGYTGQLSLGHVAFFGIGAYTSALVALGFDVELVGGFRVVHEPWPVWLGFVIAILVSGLCGYIVGKLSFRVRGAYLVIVTISFAEVVRLVALNWVELTQGPLALTSIPPMTLGLPGLGYFDFYSKQSNFYLVLGVVALSWVIISRLVDSRIGRAMVALKENESLAVSVGIDVTLSGAGRRRLRRHRRGRRQPLCALSENHRPRCFPVPLHRDDGDHGDYRRQGHVGGPDRRRPDLWVHSGAGAVVRLSGTAMDPLWAVHDPDRVRVAAGHCAGDREMVRRG